MGRILGSIFLGLVAAAAAAALVVAGALAGWGRTPLASEGDAAAFFAAAEAEIEASGYGNVAFVLIEDGAPVADLYRSRGAPVDADTVFQAASLSKWVSAFGVMTLVEAGEIDLDAPVSTYLTRWSLPESEFDNSEVTVRRVLSHTAGLTDGLGYDGFAPGEPIQSLEESLTQPADASPNANGPVRVGAEPGAGFIYSGGGYTLLQLLVEEVSGQGFADYMEEAVFEPLGMKRTTYAPDAGADVAAFYDTDGAVQPHRRYTALAPTSLYTSAADMTRFIQAHLEGPQGARPGRGVLAPATLEEMRAPHASELGAPIWGLGVMLYAPNGAGGFVVGHDGENAPAINTAARFDPATGDGIVVLENGAPLLATTIAGDWVFWNVGEVDFLTLAADSGAIARWTLMAAGGAFLLGLFGGLWVFRRK